MMTVVNHIIVTGQSLAVQPNGASLSGTQVRPTEVTYFSGGVRLPLEKSNQWPERSLADTAAPLGYNLNVRTGAASGQPYSALKKGTSVYTANINNLSAGNTTQQGLGNTVVFQALHVMHGEADAVFGTSRSAYASYLAEWLYDYNLDCSAITGQTSSAVGIAHQVSTKNPALPAHAVLDAHRSGNGWYCVGPIYQLQTDGAVHPDAENTFYLGELHSRVYRTVVVDGGVWNPLAPQLIERTGTTVVATFDVPEPPLVFDTTLFPARTNYGFGYYVDGSPITISSVDITGPNEVTISLSSTPSGSEERLVYGPPVTSFGGNLRDSETAISTLSGSSTVLHNWCCYFDDVVTVEGSPPPPDPTPDPGSLFDVYGNIIEMYGNVNGNPVPIVNYYG